MSDGCTEMSREFERLKEENRELLQKMQQLKSKYERVCPVCGGESSIPFEPDLPHELLANKREPCPTCHGTGSVPQVLLPDELVQILLQIKSPHLDFAIGDYDAKGHLLNTKAIGLFRGVFTRRSDGWWELESGK